LEEKECLAGEAEITPQQVLSPPPEVFPLGERKRQPPFSLWE